VIEIARRYAAALVEDPQIDGVGILPALDPDRRLRRRVLRGIVEQIEQHLFEENGVEFEHRQIGRQLELDMMARQDAAGTAQGAADDLAEIVQSDVWGDGAGFELGHVEQVGNKAVKPLGFVDDRRQQIRLLGIAEPLAEVAQRSGRAQYRGKRRLQVMGDRRQQGRAQPLGLGGALDAVHFFHQPHPLDRQRALIAQRIQQPPLIGGEQGTGLIAVDAHDADGAAPGMHRQEQALGAGQRIGAATGGAVVLPGPFGGGDIGFIENVLRRVAGLDRDRSALGQQQHDVDFQHQRGLIGRGPKHVVERHGASKLAAERIERFSGASALHRANCLGAAARGDRRNNDGHQREENKGCKVGRVGDAERVYRRQEKEIVRERGRHTRQQRWPQAKAHRNCNNGRQKNQIDILDSKPGLNHFRAS
jgi:hypothetical protein